MKFLLKIHYIGNHTYFSSIYERLFIQDGRKKPCQNCTHYFDDLFVDIFLLNLNDGSYFSYSNMVLWREK